MHEFLIIWACVALVVAVLGLLFAPTRGPGGARTHLGALACLLVSGACLLGAARTAHELAPANTFSGTLTRGLEAVAAWLPFLLGVTALITAALLTARYGVPSFRIRHDRGSDPNVPDA